MNKINYYVMDSSSLIELNKKYPIDIFPNLWKKAEQLINKGLLIAPEEVRKEVLVLDDSLKGWVSKQKRFFKPLTDKQIEIVKEIVEKYPSLAQADKEIPAADPFVIALAIELENGPQKTLTESIKGKIIVTEERIRGNRIRIPFVCTNYNIDCINIIEMCRAEGWKF